jgi:uncharacterized protein (TIGR02996 family)
MDDRRALMAAIIANPDEDTPRLALADWLQEHGTAPDRARAEFIRLQVQLTRTKPGKARDKLTTEAFKLEVQHRFTWLMPLLEVDPRLDGEGIAFRRGLLAYLFFDTSAFLSKTVRSTLPDALAAVGVESLCFFSPTKRISDFVSAPALRWGARLQYPGPDDAMLAAVGAATECAHLSELKFDEVSITDAGLKAFAASTGTARLRTVHISTSGSLTQKKPKFTAAGVLALLHSDRLPRLDTLELDTGTSRFDLGPLFADPALQRLTKLWLDSRTPLADVVASPHLTNLSVLVLLNTQVAPEAVEKLVGPAFAKLNEVFLRTRDPLPAATAKKLRKRFGDGLLLQSDVE